MVHEGNGCPGSKEIKAVIESGDQKKIELLKIWASDCDKCTKKINDLLKAKEEAGVQKISHRRPISQETLMADLKQLKKKTK